MRQDQIMTCKHNYKVMSWTYPPSIRKLRKNNWPNITLQCKKCKDKLDRLMTKEEVRIYRKRWMESQKESEMLHKLWHDFVKKFGSKDGWKLKGCEFMDAVDKYAEKHPEIIVTGCDDTHFASSSIVLIPHRYKDCYMGTTMIIIPQLVGDPFQCFLYPNHSDQLMEAIKGVVTGKQPDWEKIGEKSVKRLIANYKRKLKK